MKRMLIMAAVCVLVLGLSVGAGGERQPSPFQQARKLEREGKDQDAFLTYLSIPGGEYAAARLARPKAGEFLTIIDSVLRDDAKVEIRPRAILIQGDLLIAAGDKDHALRCYQQAAGMIATEPDRGWPEGLMPRDYYPVEPPQPEYVYREMQPFQFGPGSHRDNWLIRRFIALKAWDDAAREFDRIWLLHREQAGNEQFRGLGLEFAIDYAHFLKRRGKTDDALDVLLEPLLGIDMDRNPNLRRRDARRLVMSFGYLCGVSRKEFVRIAYGAFKGAGREDQLVAALQQQIKDEHNRARRVLARVRFHQGNVDEALALELEYIKVAGFDELTCGYRRGLVYEECRKLAEAAAQYEKALALPYAPPHLPDKDEEGVQRQMMSQRPAIRLDPSSPAGRAQFQADILSRLHRLYGALGRMDEVLEVTLRQFEANPSLLHDFRSLEQAGRRFRAAGKEERFAGWVEKQSRTAEGPMARANLHWLLGDHAKAAAALAEASAEKNFKAYALEEWKRRFREAGNEKLRLLLEALVKANPNDARSRLELLDLTDRFEGEEVIRALELLLESDTSYAFARGKGEYNRTKFRNYYDLAYRLMRLYEKSGNVEKLRALGLRAARGGEPFGSWWSIDPSHGRHRDENDLPEDVNACLALVIQHADETTLAELEKVVAPLPDCPARRQLARRQAGRWERAAGPAIGWANLPKEVTARACDRNVICLARDAKQVYAGMPWGVAVYEHGGERGRPAGELDLRSEREPVLERVTRVALETAALDMLTIGDDLWVATPRGVCRVDTKKWKLAHLRGDQDVPEPERSRRRESNPAYLNGANCLAADGSVLWIGTRRDVRRYDTQEDELRIFSREELCGCDDWSHVIIDGGYVWAEGDGGVIRYDRKAGVWSPVTFKETGVHLTAVGNREVWGHVYLNNELRDRPCLIDRRTLAVTPIFIEGDLTRDERCINGPFLPAGEREGELVFTVSGHTYFRLQRDTMKLRPLEHEPPKGSDGSLCCGDHTLTARMITGSLIWTTSSRSSSRRRSARTAPDIPRR